jgi:hypothetical protein
MADYSRELNKGLKIFSKLYVGLRPQGEGSVDLGFSTPFENNAAFRKRKATVDTWGAWVEHVRDPDSPHGYKVENGRCVTIKHDATCKVVDNDPREGFKVTDSLKRVYWGGGNVVWRIEDPLGFELEIQSNNLLAIIQNCDLESGIIKGKCLWARDGKDNILIHESSEEYKDAFKAAETLKAPTTVPMTERVVGGKYLLKNGTEAIYVGRMFAYIPVVENATSLYHRAYYSDHKELPAQFVSVPYAKPVGKRHYGRDRGAGTIVAEQRFYGGTVEQFDVVADVELRQFIFYAKSGAPLIRRLDHSLVVVPTSVQRLTEDTTMAFAGNRKDQIIYAQAEKFQQVRFGTRVPTDYEKTIMLEKLDKIDTEYRSEYRSSGDNLFRGFSSVGRVGDGFTFGTTQYQDFHFAKVDDVRFVKYEGPRLLLLKSRIAPEKLRISHLRGIHEFGNLNYAILPEGPSKPEDAGIDFIDVQPFKAVKECVEIAKRMINTGRIYVINYITE